MDTDTAMLFTECDDSFAILAGEDTLVSPMLAMGAAGAVLATANVCTREFVDLFGWWRSGDIGKARAAGRRLVGPASALMSEPNPTAVKAVLHAQGRISSAHVRLPLLPASDPTAITAAYRGMRRT